MSLRPPATDLSQESDVVAAGPVLDDYLVGDPPDVDEVPGDGLAGWGQVGEQRHAGRHMVAVQREMHDHEVILSDDTMERGSRMVQVMVKGRQGLLEAFPPLGSGCVLDQVLCDEVEGCWISTIHGVVEAQNGLSGPTIAMCRHTWNLRQARVGRGPGRNPDQHGSVRDANPEEAGPLRGPSTVACDHRRFGEQAPRLGSKPFTEDEVLAGRRRP